MRLCFVAYGLPQGQGSMRGTMHKGTGRVVVFHDANAKVRTWRKALGREAQKAMGTTQPYDGAVAMRVRFVLPLPKSAPKSRAHPDRKPDLDKLLRAVGDALTGIVYTDDARLVELRASKQYGEPARAEVEVYVL